jgi:hypothetical protein
MENGIFRFREYSIIIGPQAWRGVTDNLLHEFGHAVIDYRHGRQRRPHGTLFQEILEQVAREFYGHASQYGWATEYKSVYQYARRHNIVQGPYYVDLKRYHMVGRVRIGGTIESSQGIGNIPATEG